MQNFIVFEITRNAQGKRQHASECKGTEETAWKKYYQILTTAVELQTPFHSAVIIDTDGFVNEFKTFVHSIIDSKPEEILET